MTIEYINAQRLLNQLDRDACIVSEDCGYGSDYTNGFKEAVSRVKKFNRMTLGDIISTKAGGNNVNKSTNTCTLIDNVNKKLTHLQEAWAGESDYGQAYCDGYQAAVLYMEDLLNKGSNDSTCRCNYMLKLTGQCDE